MIKQQEKTQVETNQRPPIVVVLGHVDHGKTTLLDKIRETNVVSREAGGITQSIGAYEIEHGGKKITFIDTPGHEAFSKMRSRGAKAADLAILIVAADDGVKPQTKEAVEIINQEKIPYIVAINKIDKPAGDVEKIKNDLTASNVLLEGYGGSISYQAISAKEGTGIQELLDLIVLATELEDLPFDPNVKGKGFILESKMDKKRGIVASVVVKDGILKQGDLIHSGSASGKVKQLENFLGEAIKDALPSSPVLILGFESMPKVGEEFFVGDKKEGIGKEQVIAKNLKKAAIPTLELKEGEVEINLFLKADVSGSLEVLKEVVQNIPRSEKIKIKILDNSVGDISDGDIKFAISTKSLIVGFRVKVTKAAETLADAQGVTIMTSEIIYELVKSLAEKFENLESQIIKGDLEVLAVFGKKDTNQVVGGKVVAGKIDNNAQLTIQRGEKIIGQAKIVNLQQNKKDVATVEAGSEGGILIDSSTIIKVGDHLLLR